MQEIQWRLPSQHEGGPSILNSARPGIEFHHSATPGTQALDSAMRGIWNQHVKANGWQDIWYNAVVHPNGDWAKGRPWDRQSGVAPELTICFLGNYDTDELTAEAKATALALVDLAVYLGVAPRHLSTHRDDNHANDHSECPGANVEAWVHAMAAAPPPAPDGHPLSAASGEHYGLAAPVVAILPTPEGYYLVAADGGVFCFGVPFIGSLPSLGVQLAAPIVGAALAVGGPGIYMVGADGGVFGIGDAAHFHGSLPAGLPKCPGATVGNR